MKKITVALSACACLSALLLFNSSCRKAETAPASCIAALPDTVMAYLPVSFHACTTGARSYSWSFGDGATAVTDSAVHTYTVGGTYHGSLTTSNGLSNTKNFTIVVIANPEGYFTFGSQTFLPTTWDTAYGYSISGFVVVDSFARDIIGFGFYQHLPATSGVYTPVYAYQNQLMPGQITVGVAIGASSYPYSEKIYYPTSSNTQKVNLTVHSDGSYTMSGTRIELFDTNSPSDSMPVTFNVTLP
jgi:PKD repeat protein